MAYPAQPPPGTPLIHDNCCSMNEGYPGSAPVPSYLPAPMDMNKPPVEQAFAGHSKRPFLCPGLFATSPMVCLAQPVQPGQYSYTPLKLMSGRLNMECHIATVFCEFEMTVDGSTLPGGQGVVFLPKHYDATITEVTIENLHRDLMYTTILIPKDDTERYAAKMRNEALPQDMDTDADPELFMLPFANMQPGDSYKVQINWFQPLIFEEGSYKLNLPFQFPLTMLPGNMDVGEMVTVDCAINTGVNKPVDYKVTSHPMLVVEQMAGRVVLTGDATGIWGNSDFNVSYQVWGDAIVASLNVQPASKSGNSDPRGTFALSISPPGPHVASSFQRSIVYVVDRSGSMTGDPIEYARQALLVAVESLEYDDQFTIIAYDHEQIAWSMQLMDASPDNVKSALAWIQTTVTARGLTDILTPLQQAMNILGEGRGVPYVFLLTDGAVEEERDIARYLQMAVQSPGPSTVMTPRVSTFAIGPYCNHYFLKQLAVIGRGQFDVAFRPHAIQSQMIRMLKAAAMPILTEVCVTIAGLGSVELYPFPIPDLFVGLPLLVSGKYNGVFPSSIQLNGRLPNGEEWVQPVNTTQAAFIPLERVFVKQRLDILTAAAWVQDNDPRMVQQIVNLSIESAVPCQHTSMVGIETTQSKFEQMKKDKQTGKKVIPAKYAIGGAAAVTVIAGVGLAIGFGDIGASLANAPVLDAIAGGLGDAIAAPIDAIGGCCGDCCDGIGDCCGDCFDCLEEIFDAFGDICGI